MIRAWRRPIHGRLPEPIWAALKDFYGCRPRRYFHCTIYPFRLFFIQDAPKQIAQRDQRIAELGGRRTRPIEIQNHLPDGDKNRITNALTILADLINSNGACMKQND